MDISSQAREQNEFPVQFRRLPPQQFGQLPLPAATARDFAADDPSAGSSCAARAPYTSLWQAPKNEYVNRRPWLGSPRFLLQATKRFRMIPIFSISSSTTDPMAGN